MNNQRLYIDGYLMDLDSNTKITLDIKSNLFRDVTKMTSNNTYTVQLPKTVHNLHVLDHSDLPSANTKYPYKFHHCRYVKDGIDIIKDGRLNVICISDKIEVSIYWGINWAFSNLQKSDIKLNELKTNAYIKWQTVNNFNTVSYAMEHGVFYASYDTARVKDSKTEWQSYDKIQVGKPSVLSYQLVDGKIRTGTSVGKHLSGEIVDDEEWECLIVPFIAGQEVMLRGFTGIGEYRTYAILDKNYNILSIANDAIMEATTSELMNTSIATKKASGGMYHANVRKGKMKINRITAIFDLSNTTDIVEYGVISEDGLNVTKWGEISIKGLSTNKTSIDVGGKVKQDGCYVYLKSKLNGTIGYYNGIGYGSDNSYSYDGNGGVIANGNKWFAFSLTYETGNVLPQDINLYAPSASAYLICNSCRKYEKNPGVTLLNNLTTSVSTYAGTSGGGGFNTNGGGGFNEKGPVQPVVTVKWLLELITKQTGVSFVWEDTIKAYIDSLAIPLIKRSSDGGTFDGKLNATMYPKDSLGGISFNISDSITCLSCTIGKETDYIKVSSACKLAIDVSAVWSWDASKARPQGYRTSYYEGKTEKIAFYTYPPCYVEMRVHSSYKLDTDTDDDKVFIIGTHKDKEYITDTDRGLVDGRFIHLVAGYGEVELAEGDIIKFELKNDGGTLRDLKFSDGKISASLVQSDEVALGGMYPIGINLPEIKILDFIKFLSVITGTFPQQLQDGKNIKFCAYQVVWDNKSKAVDWSNKLIAFESDNKPRNFSYTLDGYCQHNKYLWATDETVFENHDADFVIDNDTLDYTQDVVTLPFAASDGTRVPIYEWETHSGGFGNSEKNITTEYMAADKYSACKDRIMNIIGGSDDQASLRFDIDLQSIINKKYALLHNAINNPHVIKEYLYLSDSELMSFDETIPVYLSQYGAYFAVTELKVSDKGYTEATMIKI